MAKLVSQTYGEALFELAMEQDKIDVFTEEIDVISEVLAKNPDFSKLMKKTSWKLSTMSFWDGSTRSWLAF